MTLEELGYRILRQTESGDIPRDKTWDIRELMDAAAQERDALMFEYISKEGVPHELISWYRNVEVKEDADFKIKYAVLPANYSSLDLSQGIQHVSSMQDPQDNYKYSQPGGQGMFSHLAASITSFWAEIHSEESRIYLINLPYNVTELYIGMVADSGSIKEGDPLPMLSWMVSEVEKRVLDRYLRQVPQDNLNNTTDVKQSI